MPINSFEDYPMTWRPQKSELERPYYLSIAANLEKDILAGKLPENTKLPPQRELADFLDLNLSTITRAYQLCELKGLLYAVTGRGTFVSPMISTQDTFFEKDGKIIEMGVIRPFYENNESILKTAQIVLSRKESIKLLEYSNPLGTKRQIDAAQKWLNGLGIPAKKENILISAGAQNALSVILTSLFKAGDKIAVDNFTYTNLKGLASFLHIQLIAVDMDEWGMSPSALANICKNTALKGIYLMPTCSNPTSIFMPFLRRQELSDIIQQYHLLLIEDDIYSFLAPVNVKTFLSLLPEQTIHICSISKSLCAGLRVAFIVFPDKFRELLISGMLAINLKTVSLNAEIAAELIENGEARRIVKQKKLLAQRRNRIFDSIFHPSLPNQIERFFHWMKIPPYLTSEELERLALQEGIQILGSHRFAIQNKNKSSFIRVSIVSPDTEEDLAIGLQRLSDILLKK